VISRVILASSSGNQELSLDQFLQLPLDQRIQLIMQRAATFYRDEAVVERQEAMRYLRTVKR
jgi:hypothetical protein